MHAPRTTIALFVLTTLVLLILAAREAAGQITYEATDLGTIGGESSEAYAINDYGQIVGRSVDANGEPHIFHWRNGEIVALLHEEIWGRRTLATAVYSVAYGISNTDHIAGMFMEPLEDDPSLLIQRGVLFRAAVLSDGPSPYPGEAITALTGPTALSDVSRNGMYAAGWAIVNADGQTLGFVITPVDGTWSDPSFVSTLDALDEASSATAVNNGGQVVGWSYGASQTYSAFLIASPIDTNGDGMGDTWYDDDDGDGVNDLITNLGTLGGDNSWARGINDLGLIVGESDTSNWHTHAFLWQDGTMTDLGTLGGDNSSASAINNNNQVVGWSLDAQGDKRAFIWENGVMTDLNDLLPSGFSARLTEPRDINDNGQIVGWGTTGGAGETTNVAFLLTPTTAGSGGDDGGDDSGIGDTGDGSTGGTGDPDLNPLDGSSTNDDTTGDTTGDTAGETVSDTSSNTVPPLGVTHFLCGTGLANMLPLMLAGLCGLKLGLARRRSSCPY